MIHQKAKHPYKYRMKKKQKQRKKSVVSKKVIANLNLEMTSKAVIGKLNIWSSTSKLIVEESKNTFIRGALQT